MTVLVAYGSQRGGTEGIARWIGDELGRLGHDVQVQSGAQSDLAGVTGVVVVGGLYGNRWHRDARRFVKRNRKALAALPVWLAASGPLDDSADSKDLPPTKHVQQAMAWVSARGEVTFGGFLAPDAMGFPASAMARNGRAGDWRNEARVRAWVKEQVHPALS